jgi:flagellar hook-associated protein 2
MKDTQITAWEDKAKSGMLRKDSILSNIVSKMRANVSEPISGLTGKYKNSASIGITTGNYAEGGKLYLDEAKLTAALNEDPDVLNKIFGTDGATGAQDGIAVRLYDTLKSSLDKISTEAGISASTSDDTTSSLAKRIRTYNTQLYNMDLRLNKIEDRYYRQFDAMESALMKLNKQSSWLSQQGNG